MVSPASGFFGPNTAAGKAGDSEARRSDYPLGAWSHGEFGFHSPQAEAQWRRDAVDSGVHHQAWDQGRKLNEKRRQLVELGFAPSADIYRGPDGEYYHMTPAAREDPAVTALRRTALQDDKARGDIGEVMKRASTRIVPEALAHMARQAPIPGSTPMPAANDNRSVANDNNPAISETASIVAPYTGAADSSRPSLKDRFGAALERGAMDGTILGELIQQWQKGQGYDPDTLATRIPERFMQSPETEKAWRDMHAPLGIAGGKRGIDLVSPEERKLYETDWERLTPEQQAAYRRISDPAKAKYAEWRKAFEARTAMPPAQGILEHGADITGALTGGAFSPENLLGLGELGMAGHAAFGSKALRAGDEIAAIGAEAAGKDAARQSGEIIDLGKTEAKAATQTARFQDWSKVLSDAQSKVYSERDARRLGGEHRGLIYVTEGKLKNEGAQAFQEKARNVIYNAETEKFASPALRYTNSNPKGINYVKFDAAEVSEDYVALIVKDAKTKLAIFSKGSKSTTRGVLDRVKAALEQNPGFKVVYEFPTEKEATVARGFLEFEGYADHIEAIARVP